MERVGGRPPKYITMAKTSKASEASKTLKVTRDLRVAGAAAAYAVLRAAAAAPEGRIVLDARQVEKVDAAGIQALLAGRSALAAAGKKLAWLGCSAQLKSAAALLGLAQALELP
jgi:anti-anti-sigma regulatory factor